MKDVDAAAANQQLLVLTDQLFNILDAQTKYDASAFDVKIADYVFFPLSFIFRKKEQFSVRLIENVTKCLRILIEHGWKANISKDLAQQLLILLTFIIGGLPDQPQPVDAPEETLLEGYRTLTVLVRASGAVPGTASPLVDISVIPAFGHTVSVILEGILKGPTPDIQIEALEAINAIYATIRDREALASFLPGTVSSLARLLSPPSSLKAQRRVLIHGLHVLQDILAEILGDLHNRNIKKPTEPPTEGESDSNKLFSPSWLRATGLQVKIALSTVLKLRHHGSMEVQKALARFCIALLDECHNSLAGSRTILVESAIISSPVSLDSPNAQAHPTWLQDEPQPFPHFTTLKDLASIYSEIGDVIKSIVYAWIDGLPRSLQSGNGEVKKAAIHNLTKGLHIVRELGTDSTIIEESLSTALRDGLVTIMRGSKTTKAIVDDGAALLQVSSGTAPWKASSQQFAPVLMRHESEKETRQEMLQLLRSIASGSQEASLPASMLSFAMESEGAEQVASFWLSFELLKSALASAADTDAFLDFSSLDRSEDDLESVLDELYAFSVSILAAYSEGSEDDWQLEATALEISTFVASRMKRSFRPELVDLLYPVSTFLGSLNGRLRSHAMLALNEIATFCEYGSVSDLLIENADYMVNSVSLRFNTLDISPATTKVLVMIINLTGPRLIPFLDDVVAAIFSALENYHGYPAFVEGLFSVLTEIVNQGSRSDALLLQFVPSQAHEHKKMLPMETTTSDLMLLLDKRAEVRRRAEQAERAEPSYGHPKGPWKSKADELLREREGEAEGREAENDNGAAPTDEAVDKPVPPKTQTYMLLSRITSLTQHYLTSPTPTLRKSLLDLLSTVAPVLSQDEDAFLPLVNDIWPVVLARLYDSEPYVSIAACRTLGTLCASAGDFLASRIKTAWWDGVAQWCRSAKMTLNKVNTKGTAFGPGRDKYSGLHGIEAAAGTIGLPSGLVSPAPRTSSGLGIFAQPAQLWNAAASLMADILSYVRVDDEVFTQMLELLKDDLDNDKYRKPLAVINPDAVWLELYSSGRVNCGATPVLEGFSFLEVSNSGAGRETR
jgi:TELO2-interacting protein 1